MHIFEILLARVPLEQSDRVLRIMTLQDQKAERLILSALNIRSVDLDGVKELVEFARMRIQFGDPQKLVFDSCFRGLFSLDEAGFRCECHVAGGFLEEVLRFNGAVPSQVAQCQIDADGFDTRGIACKYRKLGVSPGRLGRDS